MQQFSYSQTVSVNPPMKCVLIYMQLFRYAVNSNYFLRFLFRMRGNVTEELCVLSDIVNLVNSLQHTERSTLLTGTEQCINVLAAS